MPQAKLVGFSFRAGGHTASKVRTIGRNTRNQTIRPKNVPDQIAKTCPTFSKQYSESAILRDFQNFDQKLKFCGIFTIGFRTLLFARFSTCRPKAQILRDFQNRVPKAHFCEIFKMSTKSIHFARFSKCRPNAHILRDFQNRVPKATFCEMFKMSNKHVFFRDF